MVSDGTMLTSQLQLILTTTTPKKEYYSPQDKLCIREEYYILWMHPTSAAILARAYPPMSGRVLKLERVHAVPSSASLSCSAIGGATPSGLACRGAGGKSGGVFGGPLMPDMQEWDAPGQVGVQR
jgi:hypothetical protein